jgi:hypothetical protein
MKVEAKVSSKGLPLCFILTIIFSVLKVLGVVEWSWCLVTLPMWIWFALFLGVLGGILCFVVLSGLTALVVALGIGLRKLISK